MNKPEPLCEDEGCPHYGTPHICYTRQTVGRAKRVDTPPAVVVDYADIERRAMAHALDEYVDCPKCGGSGWEGHGMGGDTCGRCSGGGKVWANGQCT